MSKSTAKVVHINGVTFNAISDSKHWVPLDGPEQFGGSDAAVRPKELLLISLAGCTASDVASIMTKMREPFARFEVHVDAEMTEEHPKVYSTIHLTFKIWGEGIKESNLQKAMKLSSETYWQVFPSVVSSQQP